ncbi:MAG: hypothetical protein ABIH03_13410 [Pseudomonadota bacterium]
MNLSQRVRSDNSQVNLIWRFYSDSAHEWRWQRLAYDGTVVEHSKSGYAQYTSCLANARERGYVYLPSLTTKTEKKALKVKRSYIRLTWNHQKLVSELVTEDVEQKADMAVEDIAVDDDLDVGLTGGPIGDTLQS